MHSEELKYLCFMFGYESQFEELGLTISTIKSVLLDAESKQQELSHEGQEYIQRLKDVVYDVVDVMNEFNTMVHKEKIRKGSKKLRRFFSRSNQIFIAYTVSNEVKKLRSKLDNSAKDRQKMGLGESDVPTKRIEKPNA